MDIPKLEPYRQEVKCSKCQATRSIERRRGTSKDAKFYCENCYKMVSPLPSN